MISEIHNRCDVRCNEIDASGDFPGTTWAFFKAWRTDVDPDQEIPDFSSNDETATASTTKQGVRGGEGSRFSVAGELWRGEWIDPAKVSSRIGYSEPKEVLMVQPDASGERVDLATLYFEEVGKYLWFRPSVIVDLLSRRGSALNWYTRDTGGIAPSPDTLLHFGVNKLGLVNAYAYDVGRRPLWERRIWVAHNCRPDGGVCAELMEAQMECEPASTKPPEVLIHHAIGLLEQVFLKKFGVPLLRDHHEVAELGGRIHRFRGVDEIGLRSLAKDLVKFTLERIVKKSLLQSLGLEKSDLGTLKLLQSVLTKYTDPDYAQKRMSPLFGAYDLRGADAHLSTADIEDCYARIGVDRAEPMVTQAEQLIQGVADAIGITSDELRKHVPKP